MHADSAPLSEGAAIGLGSSVGFLIGAGFGGGISFLLEGFPLDVTLIVVLHTAVAMMLMGGWTAPALLPRDEQSLQHGPL
jgi:hypothetical protein